MTSLRPTLTRERVLRAAISYADEIGIESLSMRKLGQRLGVEAMSLYNHVANKDDILDGIVEMVVGEFAVPPDEAHWRVARVAASRFAAASPAAPRPRARVALPLGAPSNRRTSARMRLRPTGRGGPLRGARASACARSRGRRRGRGAPRAANAARERGSARPAPARGGRMLAALRTPGVRRSTSSRSRAPASPRLRRSGARDRAGSSSARRGSSRAHTTHARCAGTPCRSVATAATGSPSAPAP